MHSTSKLILWTAALTIVSIVALAGGLLLARAIRKRVQRDEHAEPFTLQDLREMRSRGEISDREHERMRAALLGSYATDPDPPDTHAPAAEDRLDHDGGA